MAYESFAGKTIAITAGGAGIGAAVARAVAAGGAKVAVIDLDGDRARTVASELGGDAVGIQADIGSEVDIGRYMTEIIDRWGRLDGIHLNAAYPGTNAPFSDQSLADVDKVLHVTVRGTFLGLQAAIRQMLSQEPAGGSIVATASTAGVGGAQGMGPYAAAKHAVIGMVKSSAIEYGSSGIRVNAVCPGWTDTEMTRASLQTLSGEYGTDALSRVRAVIPIGRMARPEEPAAGAVFLLSDEASFVNGAVLVVDGGMTAGPYKIPASA